MYSGTQRIQNTFNTKHDASSLPQEAKFKLYPIEEQTFLQKKVVKMSTQQRSPSNIQIN